MSAWLQGWSWGWQILAGGREAWWHTVSKASPGPRAVGLSTSSSSSGRKTDILTCVRLTGMADAISGHCHLAKTDMTCPYLQHFPHQKALQ